MHKIIPGLEPSEIPYIYFYNKEPIDFVAFKIFGLNAKDNPEAFGTFGTGLKHATAWAIREGAKYHLWSDRGMPQAVTFGTVESYFRGKSVHTITMRGFGKTTISVLPFTTNLAKNWLPWMVFREFRCNATDEFGGWTLDPNEIPEDSGTVFAVAHPALLEIAQREGDFFLKSDPIFTLGAMNVHPGPSEFIYYRGVAAYKLDQKSALTYNIIAEQVLTEDRTLAYIAPWHYYLGTYLTQSTNVKFLETFYKAFNNAYLDEGDWFEDKLDFGYIPKDVSFSAQALTFLQNDKLSKPRDYRRFFENTTHYAEIKKPTEFNEEQMHILTTEVYPLFEAAQLENVARLEPASAAVNRLIKIELGDTPKLLLHPQIFLRSPDVIAGLIYHHNLAILNSLEPETQDAWAATGYAALKALASTSSPTENPA